MSIDELNTKEKVYGFLQTHSIAVLSTVSKDAKPSGSPIYFIADEALNFYFVTKSDTTKTKNLEVNNNVALTIIDPKLLLTIQLTGTVEEVQEPEMFAKLSEANALEKGEFSWPPPLSKLESKGYIIMYKLTPDWLRVGNFAEQKTDSGIQPNIFHQIIPAKQSA